MQIILAHGADFGSANHCKHQKYSEQISDMVMMYYCDDQKVCFITDKSMQLAIKVNDTQPFYFVKCVNNGFALTDKENERTAET